MHTARIMDMRDGWLSLGNIYKRSETPSATAEPEGGETATQSAEAIGRDPFITPAGSTRNQGKRKGGTSGGDKAAW